MFFFNLDNLEALCKGNPAQLIAILNAHYTKKYVHRKWQKLPFFTREMLLGKSFLLNPKDLLADKSTDPSFIAQYIRLAGRRSYTFYKFYGCKYLDLSFYPEINLDAIRHNPLLKIANNHIYFKYEELNNGTSIQ